MIGIDLFAGAGGLSEGAEEAGIDVRLAVESNPHATTTYAKNHPRTLRFPHDIRLLTERRLNRFGHVDIVFGGPPCQGFSTSNQKTRGFDNPENWLFLEFLRVVNILTPDWTLFENVTGISETEGGFFLNELISGLENLGYTCSSWILNAADYGVPQLRKRLFVIGSQHGIEVEPPEPSIGKPITVLEAISDLPSLPNGASYGWMSYKCKPDSDYSRQMRGTLKRSPNHLVTKNNEQIIERYRHIPQGGNWEDIPSELMNNYKDTSKCHTKIYYRLDSNIPSVVIGNYRKNMLIHPFENRGLSVREAARLQSFSDYYRFFGSIGFQQQQVGNSVPPLLAKAVFEKILSHEGRIAQVDMIEDFVRRECIVGMV
jgi:DNA (cytosine-5)-methyltransferase 1